MIFLWETTTYSSVLDLYFRNTKRDKVTFVCLTKEISVWLFSRDERFVCMLVTVESHPGIFLHSLFHKQIVN